MARPQALTFSLRSRSTTRFWQRLTLVCVFAILKSLARYPSGPRERSAKPPFVGSNPTRASNLLVSNQWITTSFLSRHCYLGTFGNNWKKSLFQSLKRHATKQGGWPKVRVVSLVSLFHLRKSMIGFMETEIDHGRGYWGDISLGRKLTKLPEVPHRGPPVSRFRIYLDKIAEHVGVIVEGWANCLEFRSGFVAFGLLAIGEPSKKCA
jgi:hypothetical protein